jgi:hypothetical protein
MSRIHIPDLRPEIDGTALPGTQLPTLPEALDAVAVWIDHGEITDDDGPSGHWHAWPDRPDFVPAYGDLSLNTGAAGLAWYSRQAGLVLDDTPGTERAASARARARRTTRYLRHTWEDHVSDAFLGIDGTGLGYYGGLAGIATGTGDDQLASDLFDVVLQRQGAAGGRAEGWTGIDAMLGDGGIVVALIDGARRLDRPDLLAAAVRAGDMILADEQPVDVGSSRWPGLAPETIGMAAGTEVDGLELGHVGVAFVLSRLARATGERRFVEAASRAARGIVPTLTVLGDSAWFHRMSGDVSYGYCSGSSGLIRAFVAAHTATGDEEFLERALQLGRGIARSGVPVRESPGNHLVLHQCCGASAVLESYLGLWASTGDRLWLDAARAEGDGILIRSMRDENGLRWYSRAERLPKGTLKAEVGHQVGSCGIALALLRLHAYDQRDRGRDLPLPARLPDDPYPSD